MTSFAPVLYFMLAVFCFKTDMCFTRRVEETGRTLNMRRDEKETYIGQTGKQTRGRNNVDGVSLLEMSAAFRTHRCFFFF